MPTFADFLKSPGENAHATMITLFMDAIITNEIDFRDHRLERPEVRSRIKEFAKCLTAEALYVPHHPNSYNNLWVKNLAVDTDALFERYISKGDITSLAVRQRLRMKRENKS